MKKYLALLLFLCALWQPVWAQEPMVALTFDDGPSGRFTRRLLDGLESQGIRATFLLCGYRMEQYPQLTRRIYEEGHEIGLHGYSHKSMEAMCHRDVAEEIQKTKALLPAGCTSLWLRPPGGKRNHETSAAAKAEGLCLLHWSVDPKDWATHDAVAIEKQVVCQVRDGDIILLHDMSDSSVDAALSIIAQLKGQGFRFVTVSELAAAKDTELIPGEEYARFDEPMSS